jgi:NADH-quinone oxidoreductase subunit M
MSNHILSIILFTPLLGALFLLFVPKENKDAIRWIANIFSLGGFLISLPLVPWFWDKRFEPGFKFIEGTANNWIPSIGAGYVLGIDGISFLLIMLTTLLGWISILSSWTAIENRVKEYYIWFLFLQTGMLGVFMALDFFLFFVFWEAMLVPMYLLIGIWGGPRKLYAAIKFFLYTLAGSVLMLLGILFLYFHHHASTNIYTFSLEALYQTAPHIYSDYGPHIATLLFLSFFFAFAIKVPMFPFHTWLPDAHVEAPTAGSVILAGVLLKMGTYGFIRFSLPFFPQVLNDPHTHVRSWLIALSIIGILYGALVSLMQKDMKKLVAYSSVSHLGFCTLGIFVLTPLGLSGSVLQQINHGISTGALFLIVGILYERRHTREISEYGGISNVMPVYATITLIMFLSSMGLPLLNGFVGEYYIMLGTFMVSWRWAAWAVPGVVLAAAYLLWLYQRVFFGTVTNPKNEKLHDLTLREVATFVPLLIMAFWIGLYPKPFLQILEQPVNHTIAIVNPAYPEPATPATAKELGAPFLPGVGRKPALSLSKGGDFAAQPEQASTVAPPSPAAVVAASRRHTPVAETLATPSATTKGTN